jgi:predicted aminopeptidase
MTASRAKSCIGLVFAVLLAGCESIGYYTHVAGGQLRLLADRKPVEAVIGDLDPEAPLARRLALSQQVLAFAESELALDVGRRYHSYVDLDRTAVVWNLFAAPELSLEPHTWCYPFVGCAPYRGYFSRERAERYRAKLAASGFDTYVGEVTAYSTLGWFNDPLLSTFIDMPEAEFVELLFHELAHSRVWVKGDATFNESYASFVGREGLKYWLESQGRAGEFEAHETAQGNWLAARHLLERTRDRLRDVYESDLDPGRKRAGKARILDAVAGCLRSYADHTGVDGYRRLTERLNNAYLASLATYSDLVPAFDALFVEVGRNWQAFHERVAELSRQTDEDRQRWIESSQEEIAAKGDDGGADEIECKALSSHGLDGETAGAVHDDIGGGRHG